jgi:DNA-damage-inducible protein D
LKKHQQILDHMGSDELAANIFRASLTKQKLEREQIRGKDKANRAHHEMGREVRKTIIRTGATLPEDLPTPEKSVQQLQREEQKQLKQGPQASLFDEPTEP